VKKDDEEFQGQEWNQRDERTQCRRGMVGSWCVPSSAAVRSSKAVLRVQLSRPNLRVASILDHPKAECGSAF
jgi:hypothetical protein